MHKNQPFSIEFFFNSYNKTNKHTNIKITFLHKICRNSDMFRSNLIIFKDLLSTNKEYIKPWMEY